MQFTMHDFYNLQAALSKKHKNSNKYIYANSSNFSTEWANQPISAH